MKVVLLATKVPLLVVCETKLPFPLEAPLMVQLLNETLTVRLPELCENESKSPVAAFPVNMVLVKVILQLFVTDLEIRPPVLETVEPLNSEFETVKAPEPVQ